MNAKRYLLYPVFLLLFFTLSVTAQTSLFEVSDTTKFTVSRIIIIGNKITKDKIIYRELIFHVGDKLPLYVLNTAMGRSKENLMNTLLFNFVTMQLLDDIDDKKAVVITVTERWYIFPVPIFELVDPNFNTWWKSKDWSRVNYGFTVTDNNFRGMQEFLSITAKFGYSQKYSFNYNIPYLTRDQDNGLQIGGGYNRNHEINYTLENSQLIFYKNEDVYIRKEYYGYAKYTHRDKIYNYTTLGAEYRYSDVDDAVIKLNPRYFLPLQNYEQYLALTFKWTRDKRVDRIYSLKGYYFDVELSKLGFGVFKNEPSLLFLSSSFKNSLQLNNRWHYCYYVKGRITGQNEAPFYNQKALGYNSDAIRSYELYVINGQQYALYKSNLKFSIIPQRVVQLPGIQSDKFGKVPYALYLNLLFDMGYVVDNTFARTNPLANQWLQGYGIGLDFVSYYNIVFRAECSINKFGEYGLFLHFSNALY